MTDKTTAAFPCPMSEQTHLNQDCAPFQYGMSLRDYFAAKAMHGMLCNPEFPQDMDIANAAYDVADAMLRAREQQ